MSAIDYKVALILEIEPSEKAKVERELRGITAGIGGIAPGGLAPASGVGGGGFAPAAGVGGVAGGVGAGVGKMVGSLVAILGVLKFVQTIFGNQFSALGDLVELTGLLVQLYIKPIADFLFTLLKPFVIAFVRILPLWFAFLNDPSGAFMPFLEALGSELKLAAEEATGLNLDGVETRLREFFAGMVEFFSPLAGPVVEFASAIANLATVIFDKLAPAFVILWPAVAGMGEMIVGVVAVALTGAAVAINALADFIEDADFEPLYTILETLVDGFLFLRENGLSLGTAIQFVELWMGRLRDIVQIVKGGFNALEGPLDLLMIIVDALIDPFDLLESVVTTVSDAFDSLLGPLDDFRRMMDGITPGGGGGIFPVLDAVIAPGGRVVSTDPQDFLIATKDPAGLVSGARGGGDRIIIEVHIHGAVTDEATMRKIGDQLGRSVKRSFG